MAGLNRVAAEVMQEVGVNACTDITGFGLLGHLLEMMAGSRTSAEIRVSQIKLLPGVVELATSGVVPGGTANNMEHTSRAVRYDDRVPEVTRLLLNDAQTSGGLLISVPEKKASVLVEQLLQKEVTEAAAIGKVIKPAEAKIIVFP
jgi:selenide,water dikinase